MKRFVVPAYRLGVLLMAAATGILTLASPVVAATPTAPAGTAVAAAPRATPTNPTPPDPVTALTLSGNTVRSISLQWTDPAGTGLAHVMIRRAVGSQPPLSASDGTVVALLGKHATSFTDRHLTPGTTYSYAVYAVDRQRELSTPSTLTASTLTTDDRTGIKGVLTDQAGNPISGAWAEIRQAVSGNWAGVAATAANGSYRVTNLPPGSYTVCFEVTSHTSGPSPTGYLNGCYRQQPYGYGDSGTPVTVVAGKMTSGITDYLAVAGAISGRVTDPSGGGIGNVGVYVVYPYAEFFFYSTSTAADGSYTLAGLPADSYQVCFDPSSATGPSSTGYLGECYDNRPWTFDGGGTTIPVALGQTTRGIDAVLAIGGAVTGTVTDPAGNPVEGVFASLIPNPPGLGSLVSTDAQGHYTITGVAPGLYTLCFDGSFAEWGIAPYGYTSDCYDGRSSFEVRAGQTVTGQDATLGLAGAIGGSVTGTTGPVAGVWVNVYDTSGSQVNGTSTDENGNWQLPGFAPGTYTVCYDPSYTSGGYRRSCYDNQPAGPTTGTPVTVTAGQLTTVNDYLQLGAAIAGTVTDSGGSPLSEVQVTAASLDGANWYFTITDQDGNYTIGGVNPGSYNVCFDASAAQGPAAGGYLSECYDNQPWFGTPDPVLVGDSGTVTANAQLAAGSAITGTVTDSSGSGLLDVQVTATSLNTYQSTSINTRPDGSYTLPGLVAGDYTVCFHSYATSPPTGYIDQCWQNQQVPAAGTPVQVGDGSVTSGIDARLSIGGEVIGTVTDTTGAPMAGVSVPVAGTDGTWTGLGGYTDSAGHFSIIGLPAVPLVFCFLPPPSYNLSQCYRNAPDISSATPVTPTSGGITNGIDAVLQPAN